MEVCNGFVDKHNRAVNKRGQSVSIVSLDIMLLLFPICSFHRMKCWKYSSSDFRQIIKTKESLIIVTRTVGILPEGHYWRGLRSMTVFGQI